MIEYRIEDMGLKKWLNRVVSVCLLGMSVCHASLVVAETVESSLHVDYDALKALSDIPLYAVDHSTLGGATQAERRLNQFQAKPLVINFWATWCAPCVREMPLLNHFSQQNPSVQVLGLGLDSDKNIQKFLQKVQVSYPLFRIDIKQLRLLKKLGDDKGGLPFTLVLNEKGDVVWSHAGELHEDNLKKILK